MSAHEVRGRYLICDDVCTRRFMRMSDQLSRSTDSLNMIIPYLSMALEDELDKETIMTVLNGSGATLAHLIFAVRLSRRAKYAMRSAVPQAKDRSPRAVGARGCECEEHATACDVSGNVLLVVSLIIACKFVDDVVFCNRIWAGLCGWSKETINQHERYVLKLVDYNINIDEDEIEEEIVGIGNFTPITVVEDSRRFYAGGRSHGIVCSFIPCAN